MSIATEELQNPSAKLGGRRGGNILEFYTQEFKPEPSSAESFRQRVVQWFFAAKTLRFFEVSRLTDKPMDDDLASHRMICSALITFGEFASQFVKKDDISLQSVGLSVECIEAETRLLRNNFRMFHDDSISREQAEEVLKKAFNEA
jgi:hypothetical protein